MSKNSAAENKLSLRILIKCTPEELLGVIKLPRFADRLIFSMLNKNMLTEKDFERGSNFCYLKDAARKRLLQEYDEALERTIHHKVLNKNVSYRHLIRLECYKLIKHLMGDKKYEGFTIWW